MLRGVIKVYICIHSFAFYHCIPSYKRLNENYWAPTKATWGIEHRLVAVRIINHIQFPHSSSDHHQNGLHLEMRIPGADANVYLAFSAILASGLYGIRHQLVLSSSSDSNSSMDLSSVADHPLPNNLRHAVERMEQKDSISYTLFPRDFVDHFVQTRIHEYRQFETSITDWERSRYLELV